MANVAWLDGHIKSLKPEVLEQRVTSERGARGGIEAYRYWSWR